MTTSFRLVPFIHQYYHCLSSYLGSHFWNFILNVFSGLSSSCADTSFKIPPISATTQLWTLNYKIVDYVNSLLTSIPAFLPISGEDLWSKAQQSLFPSCHTVEPSGYVCPGFSALAPLVRANPSSVDSRSECSYVTSWFTQVESKACLFSGLPSETTNARNKDSELDAVISLFQEESMSLKEWRDKGRRCTTYLTAIPVGKKVHFIQMRHFQWIICDVCVCVVCVCAHMHGE